jgi:hypothetical protein
VNHEIKPQFVVQLGDLISHRNPEECLIDNRRRVRSILTKSDKVLAVVNGHLYWNRVDMHDGLPYVSVQSLVENVNNDGTPARAYALFKVDEKTMVLEVLTDSGTPIQRKPGKQPVRILQTRAGRI